MDQSELAKLAGLAYLKPEDAQDELAEQINQIITFVDQLRQVDTTGVTPLYHAFDAQQRLREDQVTEEDCSRELEELSPYFQDHLFWVPKVIDSGN